MHCVDTTGVYVCNVRIPVALSPQPIFNPLPTPSSISLSSMWHVARTNGREYPIRLTTHTCSVQDGGHAITVTGGQIAQSVKCIYRYCCREDITGTEKNFGQSGQRFIRGMGMNFNIAVAYGNCRDPTNIRPSNAGGWEINGVCKGGILIPDHLNCD